MTIHNSILELIGETPIVRAHHLDAGTCELFLKLENANPGGRPSGAGGKRPSIQSELNGSSPSA
jgi:hypothetical protein